MNMDFHYYATYLAARVAGYEKEEAKTIACAAQYVDESDAGMIDKKLLPGMAEMTPTIESMGTLLGRNVDLVREEKEIRDSECIWRSFHFLPGNIHEEDDRQVYMGERKYTKTFLKMHVLGTPEYGKEEARAFSLMCQPNSVLSEKMVNDVRKHMEQPYFLELLGIRMHVLADTWAHRYFAGTPSWWVNEAPRDVYYAPGGEKMEYSILKDFSIKDFNKYMADNYFLATPPMPSFRSFSYLGHGRMGAVPDVPFMHYRYKPKWSNEDVEKNNPEEFLLAFRQLVYAMNCVKERFYYERNVYADIGGELETELRTVFGNEDYKASEAAELWKPLIDKFYPGEAAFLSDFDKEAWKTEAGNATDKKETHYYRFNYSALKHRRYVTAYLEELWNFPAQPAGRRKGIDKTDVVMLKRMAGSDMWQWASGEIQYLGHDHSRWSAQYKEGQFFLYYKGNREHCHTAGCLDYLGEDGHRCRAVIEACQDEEGQKRWKLKIRDLNGLEELKEAEGNREGVRQEGQDERHEDWQEVSKMRYMAWDRNLYEMIPAAWENADETYLNGDVLKENMTLFVCECNDRLTISPRIHYLYRKDSKQVHGIFESLFRADLKPCNVFRLNTEQNRGQNLMTPFLRFSTDGINNRLMEIHQKEFLIDGKEEWDDITIRDWAGNLVRLYMIQWADA